MCTIYPLSSFVGKTSEYTQILFYYADTFEMLNCHDEKLRVLDGAPKLYDGKSFELFGGIAIGTKVKIYCGEVYQ